MTRPRAEVAEQADATVSNTVGRKAVRVQVPASAPARSVRDTPLDSRNGQMGRATGATLAFARSTTDARL